MGLFSKTVKCAKCGAEFEKGFLSGATLCSHCELEESDQKILALNNRAFLEGFRKYYNEMPGKFKNPNVDFQAAGQNTERIIQKYAERSAFSEDLMNKAAFNYDEMTEDDCKLFVAIFRNAVLLSSGYSTLHPSFILSHAYPGVVLDFDTVFAAAYKPVYSIMLNTNAKEQAYAFYYFTNDPFVPALGMTAVINSTAGLFSFGSDKRNREDSVNEILNSTCHNLTYPVQNIKDLKKQVKNEGDVKGNISPDLMTALIEQAEKEKGIFNDILGAEKELYPGLQVLMRRSGFMTKDDAAVYIGSMDKAARKFWNPYFALGAPELLPLFY